MNVEKIVSLAQSAIESAFEQAADPEDCLTYHNWGHTSGVHLRAVKIAQAMELTEQDIDLVEIAAAFHDRFQEWLAVDKGDGIIVRQRYAGYNETISAAEAARVMTESQLFTALGVGVVSSAIIATIPTWDVENSTVVQPFLTESSHPVVRAVALADLSSPGMAPDCFLQDGWKLFAEEQLDIMRTLRSAKYSSDVQLPLQEQYRLRYVSWLQSQAGFAKGRQLVLKRELKGLSPTHASAVGSLFQYFEESIERAEQAVERAKSTDFVLLMRHLVPNAFPNE